MWPEAIVRVDLDGSGRQISRSFALHVAAISLWALTTVYACPEVRLYIR
jgi:hypothetical protein